MNGLSPPVSPVRQSIYCLLARAPAAEVLACHDDIPGWALFAKSLYPSRLSRHTSHLFYVSDGEVPVMKDHIGIDVVTLNQPYSAVMTPVYLFAAACVFAILVTCRPVLLANPTGDSGIASGVVI